MSFTHIHIIFWSVILVSIFLLQFYLNLFLFFKISLAWSIHFLGEIFFEELVFYWFSTSIVSSFSQWILAAFIEMVLCKFIRGTDGGKRLMRIKHYKPYFFKEELIRLCQSILETKSVSNWCSLALSKIHLRCKCSKYFCCSKSNGGLWKGAIRSKSDLWTFDGFQTKPLLKLE